MNSSIVYESDAAPDASPNQNPKERSGPDFVRLRTKQRKLLRKALRVGLTREKALVIAQAVPMAKGLLPAPYGIQTSKPYPYSTFLKCVKLGFVSESDGTPLTTEQMSKIKEAIIDVVVEQAGSKKPKFEECVDRKGWLLVICSNSSTATWLKRNFCHIQSKLTFKLKLLEESNLPRKNVVCGYFPDSLSTSNEKVLEIIAAQNAISTAEWRVMNRLTQGDYLQLVLTVDNESHQTLVKMNGIISYRFGSLKLSIKSSSVRKSVLDEEEEPSNEAPPEETPQVQGDAQNTAVTVFQKPPIQNNARMNFNYGQYYYPWNQNGNAWNNYNNLWYQWHQWNQQQMYRYDPSYPRDNSWNFRPNGFYGPNACYQSDMSVRPPPMP
ncbi:uncharacterized protein LOC108111437 [Drosophila eugracilis]|uniref:uncharacterized protein LOC108111437 n=1 Tax=Drosophila eugracilis TaxID=29029 RepID=UPI001BD957AE|nr:uncharacterized protein LOC108111437 [Drosophila eugracilis]